MINIRKMKNFIKMEEKCFFSVEGKLQSLTEDFDDEVLYGNVDETYYSIPLELKALAETLEGKFIKAEILMDKRGYMEVKKLEQTSNPRLSKSVVWTSEMYEEILGLWDRGQLEAFINKK
ncbi:hypothetical protein PM10SUCC1_19330 [Propionigenium maris DSM 9537]|uniref:Uncharacterized protein n=1 Tax=Propionigenium maris DSM 9537 TaxID=1123000 RepID=A0A9W6LN17_9FUSO|nr:hypothetical protein [Propionigenium maris]GLI56419.1 hypothetical protein PM10SUCC1_19330 [Propionigenium maris DSM 9537]